MLFSVSAVSLTGIFGLTVVSLAATYLDSYESECKEPDLLFRGIFSIIFPIPILANSSTNFLVLVPTMKKFRQVLKKIRQNSAIEERLESRVLFDLNFVESLLSFNPNPTFIPNCPNLFNKTFPLNLIINAKHFFTEIADFNRMFAVIFLPAYPFPRLLQYLRFN